MTGHRLHATDGVIGSIHDFSFDDRSWKIRYVVVNTGGWLTGRQVLLSPVSFGSPDWEQSAIPVALTREQIEKSPSIDDDRTVSRQHEIDLHKYYGWPPYWTSVPLGGIGWVPLPTEALTEGEGGSEPEGDPNLRSVREVRTYKIHALDGDMGRVDDFLFEDEDWSIRYLVVDTRTWLRGKSVLVSPGWIGSIQWDEKKVYVDLTREAIRGAPEYDPSQPVTRDYEQKLYDHYGRSRYW